MVRPKLLRSVLRLSITLALVPALFPVAGLAQELSRVVVGRPYDANTLDPFGEPGGVARQVYSNIFETLVWMDPAQDMTIQPLLAESWEAIDESTFRFNLRQGVTFHSGTPFNADAVKFTFDRLLDPENPGPSSGLVSVVDSVEVVDEYTVVFHTNGPGATLLSDLAPPWASIYDPVEAQRLGERYGQQPSGTGPFRFESWAPNDRITLVANDDYWGGRPSIDELVFRVLPEDSTRVLAFERGEIDAIYGIPPHEVERLNGLPDARVESRIGNRIVFMLMNTQVAPFDDVRVRQAISYLLDTDQLAAALVAGAGAAPDGYMPEHIFGYHDGGIYPFDPEAAMELLAEAGWTQQGGRLVNGSGEAMAVTLVTPNGRYLQDTQYAEAIQAQLQAFGIDVSLEVHEWGSYRSRMSEGTAQMAILGWGIGTGDADYLLYNHFHPSSHPPDGWGYSRYDNPEVTDLLEHARTLINPDERAAVYGDVIQALHEDAPWVPLYTTIENVGLKNHVTNYSVDPTENLRFFRAQIER